MQQLKRSETTMSTIPTQAIQVELVTSEPPADAVPGTLAHVSNHCLLLVPLPRHRTHIVSQSQLRLARREYTHDVACPVHVALDEDLDLSIRLCFDDPERPSHVPFGVRGVEGFVRGEDRAAQSCGTRMSARSMYELRGVRTNSGLLG